MDKDGDEIAEKPVTAMPEVIYDDYEMTAAEKGRKSTYKPEFAELALNYCLLGATDEDLARHFGVNRKTISHWKHTIPAFGNILKLGREEADARVAKSLYTKACGYQQKVEKAFQYRGEPVIVSVTENVAPDTGAAMAWLKNRQPDKWRDRRDIEITGRMVMFSEEILDD